MPRTVILRATNVAPEPRSEKSAHWLHRLGHEVTIVAWDRSGRLPRVQSTPTYTIERAAIPAAFGAGIRTLFALVRWQLALVKWLLLRRRDYDCVHACDLDTAIPAVIAAKLFRKRLVYDIYDWYTESRLVPRSLHNTVAALERAVVACADGVIIVDESRRAQLGGAHARRLEVIYNSPESIAIPTTARATEQALRITFVGLLSVKRGLRETLAVVARHADWHIDVAGYGAEEDEIRSTVEGLPNATFHGQVSYDRALELSAAADVLFATYDPAVPNHRYSSANKLFEAMMLGKPIVVARGTGMDLIVERHDLGFVVPYGDEAALNDAFYAVAAWTPDERRASADRARVAYEEYFSAQRMFDRTRALYADVLGNGSGRELVNYEEVGF